MSKYIVSTFSNKKEILKFPDHFIALAVTVSDAGVVANADGKKIVPAGTILGGGVLANETTPAARATTADGVSNAEGVLLNDTDVTHGPAQGALVIHGFIQTGKLPSPPTEEETAALPQITFIA
ncbi:hypothetical protein [Paenibacillus sp. YYML68]|uniref:hypothetical protein n=1 Tax=Paenibacillus sp. YYML68 TaxID=2909250 RepID=UPI0024903D39|nr:hypothetical protein [Paenibacillus sp. YYML68]